MRTTATLHDWLVICEVCREKIKASEAVKRWDNLIVGRNHEGCFEERHPSDLPRPPVRDNEPLPFTRPESTDTFVDVTFQENLEGSTIPSGTFNEETL